VDVSISPSDIFQMMTTGSSKNIENIIEKKEVVNNYQNYDIVVYDNKRHLGILFNEEGFWKVKHYIKDLKQVITEDFNEQQRKQSTVYRIR
jgi:hypothetical protein